LGEASWLSSMLLLCFTALEALSNDTLTLGNPE
jgi:hypothetical protein